MPQAGSWVDADVAAAAGTGKLVDNRMRKPPTAWLDRVRADWKGWEALTHALISALAADSGDKVFMLWGAHAQAKAPQIAAAGGARHLVLVANHPSPLSARRPPAPFVGCGHFGRANAFLGLARAIDWAQ